VVAIWLDDAIVKFMQKWLRYCGDRGIIWSGHRAFEDLKSSVPYFGQHGLSKTNGSIDSYLGACIASIAANSEGRNLQRYCHNLILSPPANGARWEQLLGRTHRYGQKADTVTVDVITNCKEDLGAIDQSILDAGYIQQTTKQEQKLLIADFVNT
jgi:hypothetical protein